MFHLGTIGERVVSTRTTRDASQPELGRWLGLLGMLALVACGGTAETDTQSSGVPYALPTPVPGSRALPSVRSAGGPTMAAPRVIPIYFGADARQAQMTEFLGQLAGSEYWRVGTSEYGVGALTVAPAINVTTDKLDGTVSANDVKSWLASQFSGKGPMTSPDTGAIYTLFFKPQTVIEAPWGTSCVHFHAYHGEVVVSGKRIVFAAIPRCNTTKETELDALTRSVTHELIEASTDPYVDSHPAYGLPDERSVGWALGAGSEVTDLCAFEPGAYGNLIGGRSVARTWSNREAAEGHDPCVPALAGPYFNAEPMMPDTATVKLGTGKMNIKTIKVPVGETRTLEVAAFSDGAVDGWTLEAQDEKQLFGGRPDVKLTFDDPNAHSGQSRVLTIERLKESEGGVVAFVIVSRKGTVGHHWWGTVVN